MCLKHAGADVYTRYNNDAWTASLYNVVQTLIKRLTNLGVNEIDILKFYSTLLTK